MKKISPYWLIVAAIVIALWFPYLLAKGMFMDGICNSIIAGKLASGISSFWAPEAIPDKPLYSWGTPPLSIYLLAGFYKMFGNYFVVERIYSLLCAIVQLLLITTLWRIYFSSQQQVKRYSWLPCFLFLISPLTAWCYSNNMMENTMAIFTTAAVISFVLFLRYQRGFFWFALAGAVLVFLAIITKGPSALFLLTAPLFLFLSDVGNTGWKKTAVYMLIQTVAFLLIFALVFSFKEPACFLRHYIEVQITPAIFHNDKFSITSLKIIYELIVALSPIILFTIITYTLMGKSILKGQPAFYKKGIGFIMIGLSASLPIVLSNKQSSFYLLPALPLFAVGFAIVLCPAINLWVEKLNNKSDGLIKIACFFAIGVSLFFCLKNRNKYSRDEEILTDIENIQPLIGTQKLIPAGGWLWTEYSLYGYLYRLYGERLCMPDEKCASDFYMTKPGAARGEFPRNAVKIYTGKKLELYKIN